MGSHMHRGREVRLVWRVKWAGESEVPVVTRRYPEGEMRWYGSGVLEVVLTRPAVVVRLRWQPQAGGGGRPGPVPGIREANRMLRKVHQASQAGAAGAGGVTDQSDWPLILEYLTAAQYPDGSPRELSALIVVADAGGWRVCLSDKDNGRTLWKTGRSLLDTLQAVEMAVAEEDPQSWRQSAAAKGAKKKRS